MKSKFCIFQILYKFTKFINYNFNFGNNISRNQFEAQWLVIIWHRIRNTGGSHNEHDKQFSFLFIFNYVDSMSYNIHLLQNFNYEYIRSQQT